MDSTTRAARLGDMKGEWICLALVTRDDTVFAGDKVVTRMTWTGIHQGAFMGIAACGRRVSWTAISIIRVSAGKIAQSWVNEDTLGLLHQIGGVVAMRSH